MQMLIILKNKLCILKLNAHYEIVLNCPKLSPEWSFNHYDSSK